MAGFQSQVLSFKDGNMQLIGKYETDIIGTGEYVLYFRECDENMKWHQKTVNRCNDFYHMLYIAGEVARRNKMFDDSFISLEV